MDSMKELLKMRCQYCSAVIEQRLVNQISFTHCNRTQRIGKKTIVTNSTTKTEDMGTQAINAQEPIPATHQKPATSAEDNKDMERGEGLGSKMSSRKDVNPQTPAPASVNSSTEADADSGVRVSPATASELDQEAEPNPEDYKYQCEKCGACFDEFETKGEFIYCPSCGEDWSGYA